MILQVSMGWTNSHLHQFVADGKTYGTLDPEIGNDILDEYRASLRTILKKPGDSLVYLYDFGDGWEHDILLEDVLPYSKDISFPKCVAGERNCPPEDVGGPPGFEAFLNAYSNPDHPEHINMVEWAGKDFDPVVFDMHEINEFLKTWKSRA